LPRPSEEKRTSFHWNNIAISIIMIGPHREMNTNLSCYLE
jgi:hypothetical protein